eukprot:s4887_g3.t2
MWITGKTFSEALHVAKMDAGTFAKAIRQLGKLVRMLIQAALKLGKDTFADSLSRKPSCLMRGLPFLSPLLLRGLESSTDVHGDEGEPLWAACPDGAGARVELKPSQIGFSHRSCSAHFQDGRTLRSTLTEILAGEVSPRNIEELRVFWHQGTYYTLGNRRLCVYRLLEHCRPNTKILVRVVSESEAEAWGWKPGVALASGLLCSSRPALRALEMESVRSAAEPHSTSKPPLEQPGAIGYWHHLRAACQEDHSRVSRLQGLTRTFDPPLLRRNTRSEEGQTSNVAVVCCLGSVVSSCIGSLMCEKIMKARPYPFYTQKVHLEFGGFATATAMLFVVGILSSRPQDWGETRDVDGKEEELQPQIAGLFVGWSIKTVAALTAGVFQSWLGGLVSKRLSTVVRSVAQCLSLLIVYFFGDLVLRGLAFDWIVGAAAIVVALSVQVFTLAGQRRKEASG